MTFLSEERKAQKNRLDRLCVCAQLLRCDRLFATPWTEPDRLLCPWDFPGKNPGARLPFPSPRTESKSPAVAGRLFTTVPPG